MIELGEYQIDLEGYNKSSMRTFEIILALVLLICIVLQLFRRERWIDWVSVLALGLIVFHLAFEGYRWQMIPLYMITIGLSGYSIWRLIQPKSQVKYLIPKSKALTVFLFFVLGTAIILPILLPVPHTPEPTGAYDVGTITFSLVDESRNDLYAEESGEPRIIQVQIWYPAEVQADDQPAPWLDNMDVMGAALADKLNLPSFFLDHVKYAQTNAVMDAALSSSESQYPLLLFSHGWGGFKAQNTYQMEELASYGYIVAAPDHTYGAVATVLPDGSVALNNPEALPVDMDLSEDDFITAVQLLGDQWAGDLSHILDSLENLESGGSAGKLARRTDLSGVGVLGHSTGGGAAIQFCAKDQRCQAALGMDPYMDPVSFQIINQGIEKPYLAMFSEVWNEEKGRNNNTFDTFFANSSGEGYKFYIENTQHYDFTDMPAFSPLAPYLGLKGTLEGEKVSRIINAYTLAFFERYLNGEPGQLLNQPSAEYPEMVQLP